MFFAGSIRSIRNGSFKAWRALKEPFLIDSVVPAVTCETSTANTAKYSKFQRCAWTDFHQTATGIETLTKVFGSTFLATSHTRWAAALMIPTLLQNTLSLYFSKQINYFLTDVQLFNSLQDALAQRRPNKTVSCMASGFLCMLLYFSVAVGIIGFIVTRQSEGLSFMGKMALRLPTVMFLPSQRT